MNSTSSFIEINDDDRSEISSQQRGAIASRLTNHEIKIEPVDDISDEAAIEATSIDLKEEIEDDSIPMVYIPTDQLTAMYKTEPKSPELIEYLNLRN